MRQKISLTIALPLYKEIHNHLFPGDRDEHGGVLCAGMGVHSGQIRLLARQFVPAEDGIDYIHGKRGHKMLRGEFVSNVIGKCRDKRMVYLAVHNHQGQDKVEFSSTDYASHERGYPALLDIARGMPVGALVFVERAIAADIWMPDGRRYPLSHVCIVGKRRELQYSHPRPSLDSRAIWFDRQARIFGACGQEILKSLNVGIIGCGGVGALLVEMLARVGVGALIVADPDWVEVSNLPRLPGARPSDAGPWLCRVMSTPILNHACSLLRTSKVLYAKRIAKRANPAVKFLALRKDVLDPGVIEHFKNCDYIFLAADSMQVRLLFNALVHQYLIPGSQVGSKVQVSRETGDIIDAFSVNRSLTTYSGCLWCNQAINVQMLAEESLSANARQRQKYVDDPEVHAPSVITLNVCGVALAVNDLLFYATGLLRSTEIRSFQLYHPLTRELVEQEPRKSSDCTECGLTEKSRFARGDALRLPARAPKSAE